MGKKLMILILVMALNLMWPPNANATPTWTKIYETITPSRTNNSATSEMTYTSG